MAQCVDVIRVTNAVARQGREYRRNSEGELARIVLLTRLTEKKCANSNLGIRRSDARWFKADTPNRNCFFSLVFGSSVRDESARPFLWKRSFRAWILAVARVVVA